MDTQGSGGGRRSFRSWVAAAFAALAVVCASAAEGGAPLPSSQGDASRAPAPLRAQGRNFVDPAGRVVLLRGVNVSGGAKVPPFRPVRAFSDLDPLPALGFNVVRLVFIWEAYEPAPGAYDEGYLALMRATADAAGRLGLYVIVDLHQDGFSRYSSRGSGDGFPLWALSPKARPSAPDNGPGCRNWPLLMATDRGMHRSFRDFYANENGVRDAYLGMLGRLASAFAGSRAVIGYDLINEPWGRERRELGPFYRDAASAVRAYHPSAVLFVEGHITTNIGLQTKLDRPAFDNFAYAPHFYDPSTLIHSAWNGRTRTTDRAFAHMESKAAEWNVPLFLSEFGAPAEAENVEGYVSALYDRLDASLTSGAQWNYTPTWDPVARDGWNREDFNVLTPQGRTRPNFPPRPYPRAVAGAPLRFDYRREAGDRQALELVWDHDPARGATEVFAPRVLFPPETTTYTVEPAGTVCWRDEARQIVYCEAPGAGSVRLRLSAPARPGR